MKKTQDILFFGALVMAFAATSAWGQSRKQISGVSVGQSGASSRVDSSVQVFVGYSAGLGMGASSTPNPNSVLTNATAADFSISRYSGAPRGMGEGGGMNISELGRAPGGMKLDSIGGNVIQPFSVRLAGQSAPPSIKMDTAVFGAAADYLEQIGGIFAGASKKKPITSFVPKQPGAYRDYMDAGEKALKTGDYHLALTQYMLANRIGIDDPESLLSLAHAYFAIGYYSSAAVHLRQAILHFPEMPLIPLSPRSFYSNSLRYQNHMMRLEEFAHSHPTDADPLLLLAYFRWFADDPASARTSLFDAMQLAKKGLTKPETAEACQAFWDGMVASGKISSALETATQPAKPARTTQPATASAPATTPAK